MKPIRRKCPKCLTIYDLQTGFHKNVRNRNGHATYCKVCTRAAIKEWKAANPERAKAQQQRYVERVKAENLRGAQ